jgi:hypothetical protein
MLHAPPIPQSITNSSPQATILTTVNHSNPLPLLYLSSAIGSNPNTHLQSKASPSQITMASITITVSPTTITNPFHQHPLTDPFLKPILQNHINQPVSRTIVNLNHQKPSPPPKLSPQPPINTHHHPFFQSAHSPQQCP